jgi:predicted phosphodiesterase
VTLREDFESMASPTAKSTNLGKIEELLTRNGIAPEEIATIKRISFYQQASKNADKEVVVTDLMGIQITPVWADGPEWPVVQPAKPRVMKPLKSTAKRVENYKVAVVLPDPQIGYRRFGDELDPFHDEDAMNVAIQIMAYVQKTEGIDTVVNLGDFLDLPANGTFEQEQSFADTTQHAIDRGYEFLVTQRAAAPDAEIHLLEGNHDRRMQKFIVRNALAAFGLKRAAQPDSWPVMSLPNLLRLDELGVNYIDAYPTGVVWLNDRLRCIHGNKVRSGGSTAVAYTNDTPHISTISGHTHRIEVQHRTTFDANGPIRSVAASPGCLCRTNGAVPSANGSTGVSGLPAINYENWQQGLLVIHYKPGDGDFFIEMVNIVDGRTIWRGKEFVSDL